MKLIVGLGNPGAEYDNSRHNFGFAAVDFVARDSGAGWRAKPKWRATVAETTLAGEKILLAKPQTFYNLSGESVRAIRDFYDIDNSDILVIHDEMDLPVGTLRTRRGGAAAGNNGVANLITNLGEDFARLRIGSGVTATHDGLTKPESAQRDYVLSRPNQTDAAIFAGELPVVAQIVAEFAAGEFRETTYTVS